MSQANGTDSTPDTHPDAELIAACREHVEARDIFNRLGGKAEMEDCPLAQRYLAAFRAVDNAPPATTMEGITALARSAAAEARNTLEGPRIWDDPAGAWAGDAVLSLLRLNGEPAA